MGLINFEQIVKKCQKIRPSISPDWGQISARSLRQGVGGGTPTKFGKRQNFCGGTLRGSKIEGKNGRFFGGQFWGCSGYLTPHSEYCKKCLHRQRIDVGGKSKIYLANSEKSQNVIYENDIFGGPSSPTVPRRGLCPGYVFGTGLPYRTVVVRKPRNTR